MVAAWHASYVTCVTTVVYTVLALFPGPLRAHKQTHDAQPLTPCKLSSLSLSMQDGSTPLMIASERGHVAVVRALIEAHAAVSQHSRLGERAIDLARGGGHQEVVELLLQLDAQVQ